MVSQGFAIASGLLGGNNPNPPKTKFGKFLGNFTGRNARTMGQTTQPAPPVQNRPLVSGGITFGRNQNQAYIGFGILVAIIIYFLTNKPKRRRR